MHYVYKITSKHKGYKGFKFYIGSTTDILGRTKAHRSSKRYEDAEWVSLEAISEHRTLGGCLRAEFEAIDTELGDTREDGNREHFEGQCLNRSTTACAPLGEGLSLAYNSRRLFFIK